MRPVIHLFIHSGHYYSAFSISLLVRDAPDYSTDTVSEFHAKAHRHLSKGLAQVPYVAARVGVEPTTLWLSHRLNQCTTTSNIIRLSLMLSCDCCMICQRYHIFQELLWAISSFLTSANVFICSLVIIFVHGILNCFLMH